MKVFRLNFAVVATLAFFACHLNLQVQANPTPATWYNLPAIEAGPVTAHVDFQIVQGVPDGDIWTKLGVPPRGPISYSIEASPVWLNVHRVGLKQQDKVRIMLINYFKSCYRGQCHEDKTIDDRDLKFANTGRFTERFNAVRLNYQLNDGSTLTQNSALRQEIVIWINGEIYKNPASGRNLEFNFNNAWKR